MITMKNNAWKYTMAGITAMAMVLCSAVGCSSADSSETVTKGAAQVTSENESGSENTTADEASSATKDTSRKQRGQLQAQDMAYNQGNAPSVEVSELFSKRDLEQTADLSGAQKLEVSDGKTISVTSAGVYVVSGTAKDCTIKVEVSSDDKVQLVLDGVSITNKENPAIYVVSADKCFITTADGSKNTLAVTGSFTSDGETNTDAVIFSRDDLVFSGKGSLTVNSTYNGISGKDDLKFTGGTYDITSEKDAVEAKDSILVSGGEFTISTKKDGFHSENDEDDSLGYVYISGGKLNIDAASDGIQGNAFVQIDGGEINISSSEGIEGTYVRINDGTINISATDDGINAARKSTSYTVAAEFNGGKTTIAMNGGDVDAIDANGYVYVNGGTLEINMKIQGMCESFDYDQGAEFNGGTIIINGEEVSEIPQPKMMGGGFGGGRDFSGGNFGGNGSGRGNFGGRDFSGKLPDGFELPEGFEKPDGFPGNFGDLPDDFELPEGIELPGDFPGFGENGEKPTGFSGRGGKGGFKNSGSGTNA
jgi:hypothetical protein